ncbi:hypothetical protein PENTCL1PPCAC_8006, partial [Pristionchus entomophagus]
INKHRLVISVASVLLFKNKSIQSAIFISLMTTCSRAESYDEGSGIVGVQDLSMSRGEACSILTSEWWHPLGIIRSDSNAGVISSNSRDSILATGGPCFDSGEILSAYAVLDMHTVTLRVRERGFRTSVDHLIMGSHRIHIDVSPLLNMRLQMILSVVL